MAFLVLTGRKLDFVDRNPTDFNPSYSVKNIEFITTTEKIKTELCVIFNLSLIFGKQKVHLVFALKILKVGSTNLVESEKAFFSKLFILMERMILIVV